MWFRLFRLQLNNEFKKWPLYLITFLVWGYVVTQWIYNTRLLAGKWGIIDDEIAVVTVEKKDDRTEDDSIETITIIDPGISLWDVVGVLIVPIILVILGAWVQTVQQRQADDQAREEVLQAYFDKVSALLLNKELIEIAIKEKPNTHLIQIENSHLGVAANNRRTSKQQNLLDTSLNVIRARTLSILRQFEDDVERKSSVLRFLAESEILSKLRLNLSDAYLQKSTLQGINLQKANFQRANLQWVTFLGANLQEANLQEADLEQAIIGVDFQGLSLKEGFKDIWPKKVRQVSNLQKANLQGANCQGADLQGANLKEANLQEAKLFRANLRWTDLERANLQGVRLVKANFERAKLKAANLEGAEIFMTTLKGANFQEANLSNITLIYVNEGLRFLAGFEILSTLIPSFPDAYLQRSTIQGVDFQKADLKKADLQRLIFLGANLQDADLQEANLKETIIGGDFQGINLKNGITSLWPKLRRVSDLQEANLKGANLQGTKFLHRVNLQRANLQEVNLQDANLQRANLQGANLQRANLQEVNLQGANLFKGNLQGTSLFKANLHKVYLKSGSLRDATLISAKLSDTDLSNTDLRSAIFLATDLRATKGLTQEQLEGDRPPFICNSPLPDSIQIKGGKDRDCDKLANVLHQRDPDRFENIEAAAEFVNEQRQKTWE